MQGHHENAAIRIARLEERLNALHVAIEQARIDLNRRMEELNDVRLRFVPREVYDRGHEEFMKRIHNLESSKAFAGGGIWAYGTVLAFLLALADLLLHFFNK